MTSALEVISPSSGICTPSTSSAAHLLDFYLQYGEIVASLPVDAHIIPTLHSYRIPFLEKFSNPASNGETQTAPQSAETLSLQFLGHLIHNGVSADIVDTLLRSFESRYVRNSDIHSVITGTSDPVASRRNALRNYFSAMEYVSITLTPAKSALFQSTHTGMSKVMMLFGGQGSANASCVRELRILNTTYRCLLRRLIDTITPVLASLCQHPHTKQFFAGRIIDLQSWLVDDQETPCEEFLSTAPVSFPIIGLLDLAHYCVTCHVLGKSPDEMIASLNGVSGHSQGIVVAAAVAKSTSWDAFYTNASLAMEILFWTGFESHQGAPRCFISPDSIQDSLSKGYGQPSPMLSVRGLERTKLDEILQKCNTYFSLNSQIHVALANSKTNFVVAGPQASLYGLCGYLRDIAASADMDQTRIPFNQRKSVIYHHFLPISAPFHTTYLEEAAAKIKYRLHDKTFTTSDGQVQLIHTTTGEAINMDGEVALVQSVVDAVTTGFVDFPRLLSHPNTTHFVVFGLGRLGELVKQNRQGYGQRIICGSEIDVVGRDTGSKVELFASTLPPRELPWGVAYAPRLLQTLDGMLVLDTKLSRLLQVPPVLTAGMTPTSVPWDFVAAVMNAGYYAELAAGGYYSEDVLERAIEKLVSEISPARGITLNLIYVNPEAISWQTRLVRKLIRNGTPIDGITIGAGVPSLEVALNYIDEIGLKYISFKPGSIDAIMAVLEIADGRPGFPIILQWTGGRGGGHHSFEDFHAPILATYHECRNRQNVILVAGSGFGAGEDTYPYMSGSWSKQLGYPMMPFDGVLLGSRLMVCREAHTSPQVKQLICHTPGVADGGWEQTYTGGAGGVITVKSEMGQPIHKIANRAVHLWAELDREMFALPRPKMAEALQKKKQYIISRLNSDYAKPWFGQDLTGNPLDLIDMTYTAVLKRLIQLMYISHQKRWIHGSYMRLVYDFALRSLARISFGFAVELDALRDPTRFIESFTSHCPEGDRQQLHPDDATFFIQRCKARGQKPVNFIPILDENFESWFKKDSLWQSEDVEAVVDQDVERVCVLQGPVAVRHSINRDQSAQDILGKISDFHTTTLLSEHYDGDLSRIPKMKDPASTSPLSHWPLGHSNENTACIQTFRALPDDSVDWLEVLTANSFGWVHDLVCESHIIRNGVRRKNHFQNLFKLKTGQTLLLDHGAQRIVLGDTQSGNKLVVIYRHDSDNTLGVDLYQPSDFTAVSAVLSLQYKHLSAGVLSALVELDSERDARIKSFYSKLWLGYEMDASSPHATFTAPAITLTHKLLDELHEILGSPPTRESESAVPLDIAIIIAWEVLVKPLLLPAVKGDLLRLVHRENTTEYCPSATPFQLGDALQSSSHIQSINIEETGKSLVVKATIERNGSPVAWVTSTFFLLGSYTDFNDCFERIKEPEIEIKVSSSIEAELLRSRSWLSLDDPQLDLVGKTLSFRLTTLASRRDKQTFEQLSTTGLVIFNAWNGEKTEIGRVAFQAGGCKGNPVLDFLGRKGDPATELKELKHPVQLYSASQAVRVPESNEPYSQFSKDFNPIHISEIFSQYAELPGTITHGMYTSAAIRSVVERTAADGDIQRFRRWSCSFVGMVLPGDQLDVHVDQIGLVEGRLLLKVAAMNNRTQETVLRGEAEVDQAPSVYVFTGQGSQSLGMGMTSYQSSPAAKKVWDDADQFLLGKFGWSVLELVRSNPKLLTVYFRGQRGRQLRSNYMAMTIDSYRPDGSVFKEPIIKDLTSESISYTFSDPRGLLFSTQFAQPIIVLLEQAAMADLKDRGIIQEGASFAGHSLGEYGALSAFAEFMRFEDLLQVVFYRGLAMQIAIERDDQGRTNFSMAAVNPIRVGEFFKEAALRKLVEVITTTTNALLEIVNFNVEGEQYVCAGTLENLHALGATLDYIAKAPGGAILARMLMDNPQSEECLSIVSQKVHEAQQLSSPITVQRSTALIPLQGIDVPFHSAHLRGGVPSYRSFLEERIRDGDVDPQRLIGKWIPNVMGKPFSLSSEYLKDAHRLTASPVLGEILSV
ncbi:beta subunit of fatty acid synthase [Penicillium canescens]|nr:beta subunit of fatty acid synthase [Penicillium canescens]